MLIRWLDPHYEEDDGKGSGGDGKVRASDLRTQLGTAVDEQALMRLLEKHADVLNDNHRLREQRSTLKQQLVEAQGKVPGEGSAVLTKEDVTLLEAYKALGADAATLKATITERDEAKQRLAFLEREKVLRDVSEVAGYKAAVLGQLPGSADLAYEVRDVTADGKTSKVVFVKGQDGQPKPITDYAQEHWADFLPALRVEQPTSQGTAYVQQSSGGKPPVKDIVEDHLERQETRRKAQTNPLMRKTG